MRLQVTHITDYRYEPGVSTAQHLACLLPRDLPSQRVHAASVDIFPRPESLQLQVDVFGNQRHYFAIPHPHDTLRIEAKCEVETQPRPALAATDFGSLAWETVRDHFRYRAGAPWDAATEFVFASHHVPRDPVFEAYALPSFTPRRPLLEAAIDLMQRIHREFNYVSQSTTIYTPVKQALARREGVCQDFSHILLACLRSLGLSARYVSGYLLTVPQEGHTRLVGSDASHAWVSVYLPSQGDEISQAPGQWIDLDPTNNRWGLHSPGPDFVTVALGRDFADVSPVRGVIFGGARHTLKVSVTVEPLELAHSPLTTHHAPPTLVPTPSQPNSDHTGKASTKV